MASPTMTPAEARHYAEKAIAEKMPLLIDVIVSRAAEGDLTAAKLLLNKLVPDAKFYPEDLGEDAPIPKLEVILKK